MAHSRKSAAEFLQLIPLLLLRWRIWCFKACTFFAVLWRLLWSKFEFWGVFWAKVQFFMLPNNQIELLGRNVEGLISWAIGVCFQFCTMWLLSVKISEIYRGWRHLIVGESLWPVLVWIRWDLGFEIRNFGSNFFSYGLYYIINGCGLNITHVLTWATLAHATTAPFVLLHGFLWKK